MEFLYTDRHIAVCVKPPRVISTDQPGGMPELVAQELGLLQGSVRTVHRLDRVVSGLMVLALSPEAAGELSRQIREGIFEKEYLAVLRGIPETGNDTLRDLLYRDKRECKTYVTQTPGKGVQEAVLSYRTLGSRDGLSRVQIILQTGRTHQIRAQFSSRGLPLVGDRKYSTDPAACEIALWSYRLAFVHPVTGAPMTFALQPPESYPWNVC